MIKKLSIFTLLLIVSLSYVSPLFAQDLRGKPSSPSSEKRLNLPQRFKASTPSGERLEKQTANLKERATKEIDRRISSLTRLLSKISSLKKLNATQIAGLQTQVQSEIDKLNVLKTEINEITDYASLKEKVKSIITEYRIYALFMPKIHIMASADGILNRADEMASLAGKLELRIITAKNEGKDTAIMEAKLTEMKQKIELSKTQANSVLSLVLPLTPAGYPANRITLQNARKQLKDSSGSLKIARRLAGEIVKNLKTLYPGVKASPTPTTTL